MGWKQPLSCKEIIVVFPVYLHWKKQTERLQYCHVIIYVTVSVGVISETNKETTPCHSSPKWMPKSTLLMRTQHQWFDMPRCYWCNYICALLSKVTFYHSEIIVRYKCYMIIPVYKFESKLTFITQVVEWSWQRTPCRQKKCPWNLCRRHLHQQERTRWACVIWKTAYRSYTSLCMFRAVHPWTSIQ